MEVKKEYWVLTGKPRFEGQYQNGKEHGVHRYYYIDGTLEHECQYQNGKLHGVDKYFDPDGQIEDEYYCLYGNEVSEEEYRHYKLVKQLSGVKG